MKWDFPTQTLDAFLALNKHWIFLQITLENNIKGYNKKEINENSEIWFFQSFRPQLMSIQIRFPGLLRKNACFWIHLKCTWYILTIYKPLGRIKTIHCESVKIWFQTIRGIVVHGEIWRTGMRVICLNAVQSGLNRTLLGFS